jgi:hypothetical protein
MKDCLLHGRMTWVTMDSIKYNSGSSRPTLLRPAGGPPLKWPYNRFRGGLPACWVACGRLLPSWTPHALHLWSASNPAPSSGTSKPFRRRLFIPIVFTPVVFLSRFPGGHGPVCRVKVLPWSSSC